MHIFNRNNALFNEKKKKHTQRILMNQVFVLAPQRLAKINI